MRAPWALVWAITACGPKDDTVPDDTDDTDAATGTGTGAGTGTATGTGTGAPDTCPSACENAVDDPKPPVEHVDHAELHLSARATRQANGTLKVIVNPLVVTDTGQRIFDLRPEDVTVTAEGADLLVTSLYEVSELDPVNYDLVFVVDTTDQMQWSIDAVRDGVIAFATEVAALGIDLRVGAVEYGDEVRTSVGLGEPAAVRDWAAGLAPTGGGDGADNALDALLYAVDTFAFRPDAQRYVILLVGEGFHECRVGCSETNLAEIVRRTRGSTLYGMVHTRGPVIPGLDPQELILSAGGLYQPVRPPDLVGFDVASGTQMDELLVETYTLTALELPPTATEVTVTVTAGSRTAVATIPVGQAPE